MRSPYCMVLKYKGEKEKPVDSLSGFARAGLGIFDRQTDGACFSCSARVFVAWRISMARFVCWWCMLGHTIYGCLVRIGGEVWVEFNTVRCYSRFVS